MADYCLRYCPSRRGIDCCSASGLQSYACNAHCWRRQISSGYTLLSRLDTRHLEVLVATELRPLLQHTFQLDLRSTFATRKQSIVLAAKQFTFATIARPAIAAWHISIHFLPSSVKLSGRLARSRRHAWLTTSLPSIFMSSNSWYSVGGIAIPMWLLDAFRANSIREQSTKWGTTFAQHRTRNRRSVTSTSPPQLLIQ